jgi:hypothetical protein
MACHAKDKKQVGPSFKDIAARYKGQANAVDALVAKVRAGGKGVYGPIPMPPHPPGPRRSATRRGCGCRACRSIRPAASSSCSTREKYSGVSDSRDAMVALLTGSDTVTALAADAVFGRLVAQQVADDALQAAVQRIGLHVVHQAVQAARDAGQHAHREARVVLDLAHHRGLADDSSSESVSACAFTM